MGKQKLLLPYGSKTVIEHIIDELRQSPVSRITVVTGHDHERIVSRLNDRNVTSIRNPNFTQGMITSVRSGLETIRDEATGCLLALGDQPGISPGIVAQMIERFHPEDAPIVYPLYNGQKGHPLIFSNRYFNEIKAHYDDVGLRGLLQAHPTYCHPLTVDDDRVLEDIDTPEDYEREKARLPRD